VREGIVEVLLIIHACHHALERAKENLQRMRTPRHTLCLSRLTKNLFQLPLDIRWSDLHIF
jgi:hypothetical protein